jgi:excisionase family DNA binding protein
MSTTERIGIMETSSAISRIAPSDNLTPRQAAALLNVPEATLAVWRSTNRVTLPFFKLGHHVRYRRSDLEQFIAFHLRHAPEAA